MEKKRLISRTLQRFANANKRYQKEGKVAGGKKQSAVSKAVRNLKGAVSKSNLARKRIKRASVGFTTSPTKRREQEDRMAKWGKY